MSMQDGTTLAQADQQLTVPDSYAVVYKEPIEEEFPARFMRRVESLCAQYPVSPDGKVFSGITDHFSAIFHGFAGSFHPAVVDELRNEERVEVMGNERVELLWGPYIDQPTGSWALADISRSNTGAFNPRAPSSNYVYHRSSLGGEGVTIHVIDSGYDSTSTTIEKDRVEERTPGASANIDAGLKKSFDEDVAAQPQTSKSHGTLVATFAAGTTMGAAPKAKVVVWNAVKDATHPEKDANSVRIANAFEKIVMQFGQNDRAHLNVINCSFGRMHAPVGNLGRSLLRKAVEGALAKNFLVVAAAGNSNIEIKWPTSKLESENADAGAYYPACIPGVLTVGAYDLDRKKAFFSNYGEPVGIWAPGVNFVSSDGQWKFGTSFAAPLVSGIAACILAEKAKADPNYRMKPKEVQDVLLSWCYKDSQGRSLLHNRALLD
ncbi:serine protease [Orbilia brochopaga]|uniref:Serine protease n=1 Tax=Orbilia brochopaga TaxID=3140254 RepID=A0AAV9ULL5_9PEZI